MLLINLGTPDSTNWWEIRRYLKEFLSDRRVIEANPIIWKLVLNLIILTFRPSKTAKAYKEVWLKDTDESPLRYYTRMQAEKLAEAMDAEEEIIVDWAMRYGNPSIASRIASLKEQGCHRILIMPLYPQYAAATNATVCDEVFRTLMKMRWQPTVRVLHPYDSHEAYIDALAESLNQHIQQLSWKPEVILASYHGLPKDYFDKGDPYHCYCYKTTRLLRERLGMLEEQLRVTFQSRFGPKEWLQPYTDETVKQLAQDGVKRLTIITPGFASDCIETIEEIGLGVRDDFLNAGGQEFSIAPCLNDSEASINMLEALARENLQGWL